MDEYRKKSMLKNQVVMVRPLAGESDEAYQARVEDISDDEGLLVRLDDGTQKILCFGEVTLHK